MKVGDLVKFIVQTEHNQGARLVTETQGAWAKLLGFEDDPFGGRRSTYVIQGNLEIINENR